MIYLVDMSAAEVALTANAGDDIDIPATLKATDSTGWTFLFTLSTVNTARTGPADVPLYSIVPTNSPGSPNSIVSVHIPAANTAGREDQTLWCQLRRTNSGSVRTLYEGVFVLK